MKKTKVTDIPKQVRGRPANPLIATIMADAIANPGKAVSIAVNQLPNLESFRRMIGQAADRMGVTVKTAVAGQELYVWAVGVN